MKRLGSFLVVLVASGLGAACDNLPTKPDADLAPLLSTTGTEDVTPPALTAFSFTPTAINMSEGPATVTVSFTVADDLSGAVQLTVRFESPSGAVQQAQATVFPASESHTGSVSVEFPQYSAPGIWTVGSVSVYDAAGNYFDYYTGQLATLGFPTELLNANTLPGDTQVTATYPDGTPSEVSLTFEAVSAAGQTVVTKSPTGPPPPNGFRLGDPTVYYDLTTTALYSGPR
ncbi:MAG: hypothetical protein HY700_19630 [Gemmatimonadetes bacterium]|nr:hypothetical protein [Gemmatimonadota bacterium]